MPSNSSARQFWKTALPRPIVRFAWNAFSDLKDFLKRPKRQVSPKPLRVFHNVGGGDYHTIGTRFAEKIASKMQMHPDWSVLDIGCGTGRVAAPLIDKLGPGATYTGFDVSRRAIRWARRHVTSDQVSVQFEHVNAQSAEYNLRGKSSSARISFPKDDESVELCFAVSLFTHLRASAARHYLAESARVLKPGHCLFLTAFLIDVPAQIYQVAPPKLNFRPIEDRSFTTDPKAPEHAMAFEQEAFMGWAKAVGLHPVGAIQRGTWSGRTDQGDFQDEIIFEKRVT